jgi:hypothetical protein
MSTIRRDTPLHRPAEPDPAAFGTLLGVWAHPDDEVYLSGGLMRLLVEAGHRVVCATATRGEAGTDDPLRWPPELLAAQRERELAASLTHPAGTMIGCGEQIITLHGHPRLVDLTGAVVAEWPDVAVSTKTDSYGVTHLPTPVAALHPSQRRLAAAQPDHIAVIHLPTG